MSRNHEPVSTTEWFILYLIMLVPIFNLIKLIVMAGDKDINPILSNWAKAVLIFMCIAFILGIVFQIIMKRLLLGSLPY